MVPLCLLVRTIAEDRAMAAADQEARSVAILVAGIADEAALAEVVDGLDPRGAARPASSPRGHVLGPGTCRPTIPRCSAPARGEAFTVVDDEGGRVLLPVVTGEDTAVVRSSVAPRTCAAASPRPGSGIIGLGLLLLALGAAIANRLGRRISEPLLDVADVAHQLREGDLSARAEVRGTEETVELARALNGLAERTTELLAEERLAVADLSHRLRTPVTALRLDAEAVTDAAVGERLQEHIGVLQRSIDAIVREARRPVRTDLPARTDAVATVQERVDHWRALAEDQGRRTDARLAAGPLMVAVARDDLADLVDVLLDNVFAHTTEPAAFAVHLDRLDGWVRLVVEDEGDGPDAARRRAAGLHRARPRRRPSYGGLVRRPAHVRAPTRWRDPGRGAASAAARLTPAQSSSLVVRRRRGRRRRGGRRRPRRASPWWPSSPSPLWCRRRRPRRGRRGRRGPDTVVVAGVPAVVPAVRDGRRGRGGGGGRGRRAGVAGPATTTVRVTVVTQRRPRGSEGGRQGAKRGSLGARRLRLHVHRRGLRGGGFGRDHLVGGEGADRAGAERGDGGEGSGDTHAVSTPRPVLMPASWERQERVKDSLDAFLTSG